MDKSDGTELCVQSRTPTPEKGRHSGPVDCVTCVLQPLLLRHVNPTFTQAYASAAPQTLRVLSAFPRATKHSSLASFLLVVAK